MEIVAKVFDLNITQTELDFEVKRYAALNPNVSMESIGKHALTSLIESYLLMHEALENGIQLEEEEYEDALLCCLDDDFDESEFSVLLNRSDRGEQLERILRSELINNKYINSKCVDLINDNELYKFYLGSQALFTQEEQVRASHILIKGLSRESLDVALEIRKEIHSQQDFMRYCTSHSQCPSGTNCGDLGYFHKGIMLPEIDEKAFNMNVGEISEPFPTRYGYHIMVVTEKQAQVTVPFEKIKDSLHCSLLAMKKELAARRLMKNIQQRYSYAITIY